MKAGEFEVIARLKGFDSVVLMTGPMTTKFELWVWGPGVKKSAGAWIAGERGTIRQFASLDTGYAWIRAHGYDGKVCVQSGMQLV